MSGQMLSKHAEVLQRALFSFQSEHGKLCMHVLGMSIVNA